MKLLHKYSRINLISSVIIFCIACTTFYFLLHFIFLKQLDEDLRLEQKEISSFVDGNNSLPEIISSADEVTTYTLIKKEERENLGTVVLTNSGETEDYRQLQFSIPVGGKLYRVAVGKSLGNTEHVIHSVILVSVITILVLLAMNYVMNRIVLRRLWQPFYTTMKRMKDYRIGRQSYPEFPQTDIEEFTALYNTLSEVILHSENEYKNLKEFTENASHEMQTPVAVISSKMDLLIQDEHLSESQSRIVQVAYSALQKLTRLNRALLLLARIENRQFAETEPVSLDRMVGEKLISFRELIQNKKLVAEILIVPVTVMMNVSLADILFNNLLGNCVNHSEPGSKIIISLTEQELSFCNGPCSGQLDTEAIFTRFYKGKEANDRHGLGLAIAKEICAVSGFKISYDLRNGFHAFTIKLAPEQG